MAPGVLVEDLTREQIRALAPRATVVIPTAAIEQHGPHLPISVDRDVAGAVAERAARRAAATTPILVAPVVAYGISAHHFPFPGVLSLSPDTFLAVLRDLGDSLVRSGFRRIFILNAHGGNDEAVRLAAREIALAHRVVCGAASYWTLAWDALIGEGRAFELGRLPGHAGAFETALMLALRPDLLKGTTMPPAVDTVIPSVPAGMRPLIARPETSDGTTGGYSDNPARATPEAGARLLEIITREVARTLVEFAAIDNPA